MRHASPQHENLHPKMKNELKTIRAMISIYCTAHHHSSQSLCNECEQLYDYATKRLMRCPFQADKPTCGNCTIHCYKHEMRDKIKNVMRYAGPRMIYRHPILAIYHLLDSKKKIPIVKSRR